MPTSRARRGLKAEIIAAEELGRLGYRILDSNYRCRYGEIDLIALEGDTLVFVEVRSRKSLLFGTPAESVTTAKQEKLLITADHYISERNITGKCCRFDVVSVVFGEGSARHVEVIKNAFGQ
jgi:putative endonuclease